MESLQQQLEKNLLEKGGLATEITGRCESNRKALADLDPTKRTAGEVAKSLRKNGFPCHIKEVKFNCPEYHHAGRYGKSMGKTYYTKRTDEEIKSSILIQRAIDEKMEKTIVCGVYYTWEKAGRKSHKVLQFYRGTEAKTPRNFTELKTEEGIARAEETAKRGKEYYGWNEPEKHEFE